MRLLAFSAVVLLVAFTSFAAVNTNEHQAPKFGEFPLAHAGKEFAGELVSVDHVNRRGVIRPDGDGSEGAYHDGPMIGFAMLPYGMIRFHGAPAELRDIPIGTRLHGRFLIPPGGFANASSGRSRDKEFSKYTAALLLEDDFSHQQRDAVPWQVKALDVAKGRLTLHAVVSNAPVAKDIVFTVDRSTRVWKGRGFGALEDIASNQVVLCNFTWAPDWQNGQMHVADVWIDPESRAVATERQRQIHIRHQKHRWLAGWVDHVEHQPGGKGIVTLTIFGGMDPSLYEDIRRSKGFAVAAAEPTLRTWWQDHDKKSGELVERKELPSPPPGSSGIQLRIKFSELLEGYRPGYIVRLRPNGWPNVKMPPEERIKGMEDRDPVISHRNRTPE